MDSSLNLNTLANSLPSSSQAIAEKELLNDFKAAALSITTLYRSSRRTSKRAYNTGYASACRDLLEFIQHGVSAGGAGNEEGGEGGITIGRVMDWVEARVEAIKAREEEEDEEGSADGMDGRSKPATQSGNGLVEKRADSERPSTQTHVTEEVRNGSLRPTPPPPSSRPLQSLASPSPPPPPAPVPIPGSQSSKRSLRQRSAREKDKDKGMDRENFSHVLKEPLQPNNFTFASPTSPYMSPNTFSIDTESLTQPFDIPSSLTSSVSTGMKRRHGTLTEVPTHSYYATTTNASPASANLPAVGLTGSSRRRARAAGGAGGSATRGSSASQSAIAAKSEGVVHLVLPDSQNGIDVPMAMDVEEESGRERKRVARR